MVQDPKDPSFSTQSLRITSKYNLKVNGGFDKENIVVEIVGHDSGDPRIRIQTAVNSSVPSTVLYMHLHEFLNALGITKGDLDGKGHKEAVAGEQAVD